MKNGKLFKQVFAAIMCVAMLLCSLPGNALNVYAAEATPSGLWTQIGEIDTTTGGAWHTVGGYGTEQAIFITAGNRNNDGHTIPGYGTYRRGGGGGSSQLHIDKEADAITLSNDLGLGAEFWSYAGTEYDSNPTSSGCTPAYETPAEIFDTAEFTPKYNAHPYWTDGGINLTGTYPVADDLAATGSAGRNIATFNVPESKANTPYYFTVYINMAHYVNQACPSYDFDLIFFDMNDTMIGDPYRFNTGDFGKEGGYVTFLVQGSFRLAMDKPYVDAFGFNAFFFDEYTTVEELPENVLEGVGATLWNPIGDVDKTTGGAWHTVGGYGTEQAIFITAGNRNNDGHTIPGYGTYRRGGGGGSSQLHIDKAADAITLSNDLGLGAEFWSYAGAEYDSNPTSSGCTPAYETPAEIFDTAEFTPKYNAHPYWTDGGINLTGTYPVAADLAATGSAGRNIATFNVPESKAGKYYTVTVYINMAHFVNQACPSYDFDLIFFDMNDTMIGDPYRFNTGDFGKEGGYVTFLVQGSFRLAMDRPYSDFGFNAFFFDEYTPVELEEPTPATSNEIWSMVGEIDQATGGYWHTRGYGDEQAIFITAGNRNNDGHTIPGYGTYRRGGGGGSSQLHIDRAADAITLSNDLGLGAEFWSYAGTEPDSNPTSSGCTPAYETPAEVFDAAEFTPKYNAHPYWTDGSMNLTGTYPVAADLAATGSAGRNIATFNVPESKANTPYYFTVYINMAHYVNQDCPSYAFDLIFFDMNDTMIGDPYRFNTSDFGKEGGYVTFLVKGSFRLAMDKSYGDAFGFNAFFFNEKLVEPVPQGPEAGTLLNQDYTTGGAWHTVGGYGTEQAIFITSGNRNNDAHPYMAYGTYRMGGNYGGQLHIDTAADAITLSTDAALGVEYWSYAGAEENSTPANSGCTPAYETPAEVFGTAAFTPLYNAYPYWTSGETWTGAYPIADDLAATTQSTRNVATFTVPESKAGKYYTVTVYINMAHYVNQACPSYAFDLFLLDMNGNKISEKYRFNTGDFGKEGGYVTFLVQGSFRLAMDKPYGDAFGFNAFFFDEYTAPNDEASSLSVTLGDPIGVNYGMKLSVQALLDSGAHMEFRQENKDNVVNVGMTKAKSGKVYFTKGVSAKEMADVITGKMVYSDGSTGKEYQQSVQGYARKLLGYTTTYENPALKDVVVRMLNYGAACQTYWDYNTGNMANKDLATAVKTNGLSSVGTKNLAMYARAVQAGNETVSLSYASLLLKSETILRLGFPNAQAAGKTFKLNGVTLTPVVRGANTYVDITNIAAAELDNTYTVEIYEGENLVSTVKYSPLAYVHAVLTQSEDANLINVVKSLYLYNLAANEYFK